MCASPLKNRGLNNQYSKVTYVSSLKRFLFPPVGVSGAENGETVHQGQEIRPGARRGGEGAMLQ